MDKKTYGHPVLSQILNENYYPVKFNAEEKKSIEIFGRKFSNPNTEQRKGRNSLHEFTQYMNVGAVRVLYFWMKMVALSPFYRESCLPKNWNLILN
jgi:hypothetical protein